MYIVSEETKEGFKNAKLHDLQELHDECNISFVFANGKLIDILKGG